VPRKILDQVLIVDVEATCWEGPAPEDQESEIIEIGLCTLDVASGERLEKRSLLVKPQRSRVSPFCTELTSITQLMVDHGMSFMKACTILRQEYASKERVWASYGDYDRRVFERQCREFQVEYPFGVRHLNIKTLFALVHATRYEPGMAEALRIMQLPLEGTHHRGGDDAWNIAGILSALLKHSRTSFSSELSTHQP
jgi:inhibitor of KinA sporulation pathway (predicted exonuclease)